MTPESRSSMSENKKKDKVIRPSISMVWSYMDDISKLFIAIVGVVLILLLGSIIFKLTINLPAYISVAILFGVIIGVVLLACIVRGVISIIKDIKQSYECALSSLND